MNKIKETLKERKIGPRRRDVLARIIQFAQDNGDIMVIALDPKKDEILLAYKKHYAATNIRTKILNLKVPVVRSILKGKDLELNINRVLKVFDAFLYNTSRKINSQRSSDNQNKTSNELCPRKQKKKLVSILQKENLLELIAKKFTVRSIGNWLKSLPVRSKAGK